MKIKRFFAQDIRQAIRMVREEQGPDAVILSNRRVDGGVEIVAAVDYDENVFKKEPEANDSKSNGSSDRSQVAGFAQAAEKAFGKRPQWQVAPDGERDQGPALAALKSEMKELRGLVESQLSGLAWGDNARRNPTQARLLRDVMNLGIKAEVARRLVGEIDEQMPYGEAWRKALAVMGHALKITDDDILTRGGVVALVGPTGVGKTTTIAKLAARYILRHGKDKVGLITTDNYRIGALEQLRTYGRILGAPVYVAANFDELESAVQMVSDKELVLIDTAGMSQRDVRLTEQFAMLQGGLRQIRSYLVLSAITQVQGLDEAIGAFKGVGLNGCILTKIDEAASLGEAISMLIKHELPVAYISEGQKVPEDLQPARSHSLVTKCVSMAKKFNSRIDDEAIELEYGRMVVNAEC
ncbi:MAG: flagellar biosynthesis protein FlhF [Pseudomonadota bacterium]